MVEDCIALRAGLWFNANDSVFYLQSQHANALRFFLSRTSLQLILPFYIINTFGRRCEGNDSIPTLGAFVRMIVYVSDTIILRK